VRSKLSRRTFLSTLGLLPIRAAIGAPLFEEIPAAASGLRWVHNNAFSAQRFLPETMGPSVAFLDFDNDGWMDIFLVNSGPCDFFQPAEVAVRDRYAAEVRQYRTRSSRARATPSIPGGGEAGRSC
jgi:hypothetical protein